MGTDSTDMVSRVVVLLTTLTMATMGAAWNIGGTNQIQVTNGAVTDATLIGPESSPVKLVWGHGLGSKDPELKNRFNDAASNVTFSAMEEAGARCVCYDARGHGASHGWEGTADQDRLQFSWPHLGRDMLEVATVYGLEPVIVGGSSMGSASALYAAMENPSLVSGLILVRPPTAWEERLARKPQLIQAARDLHLSKPDSPYYNVLLGSAVSDLPPHQALDKVLDIPVLILTAEGDPTHPVSTARQLSHLSSDVTLVISESYDKGKEEWPGHIASFLQRH